MKVSGTPLLPFAAATLLLLLNYPWLSLFASPQLLGGMPPLFLYLFTLWLVFILIVRLLLRPGRPDDLDEPPSTEPANEDKGPDA
jgi:hypothetical protein